MRDLRKVCPSALFSGRCFFNNQYFPIALQEEFNKEQVKSASPEALLLEKKVTSRLHQLESETKTGFIMGRMGFRVKPIMAVYVNKPKEKIFVLFQHFLLAYHATKTVDPLRPEECLDLSKSNVTFEDDKKFIFRIRNTL